MDFILKFVALLIGIISICIGVFLAVRTQNLINIGEILKGTVIEIIESRDTTENSGSSGMSYVPRIQFDANGTSIEFKSTISTSYPKYRVGDLVEVIYLPDNPSIARINSDLWTIALLALVFGTGFTVSGCLLKW